MRSIERQANRREIVPENSRGRFKRGLEALGVLRKTSERPNQNGAAESSNRSSSPEAERTQSMSASSSSFATTPSEAVASPSTQSTSNGTEFASWAGSKGFTNPEVEGECEVEYTIRVKGYGVFERVEQDIARTLAIACYRSFFEGSWALIDEAGRYVEFDSKASFHSNESVRFVDKPS